MSAATLRNRLLLASALWKQATDDPLPKMPPGEPADQVQAFELQVVELLCSQATAETARKVANQTWDMVHDRPDTDPVKQRVTECHEALARLSAGLGGQSE